MVDQDPYTSSESAVNSREVVNRLCLWPAWLIAALQMVALVLTVSPSIRNLPRFLFMMAGPLVAASLFSFWMLLASKLRWREKLALTIAGIALPGVAVWICAREDAMRTVLWIYGVPLAQFMIIAALTIWPRSPQRTMLAIVFLSIGWASFALVRTEGFDGDYFAEFNWRWSARHEEMLPALENLPNAASEAVDEFTDTLSWSQYRGPAGNGTAADEIAAMDWALKPPTELWRIAIGPGWGSFSYDKGRLFTQEQRGEKEHITCYSSTDGHMVWTHADEARFSEVVSGAGPRSTPSVVGGYVYALGGKGLLTCLNDRDGTVVWQRDLVRELSAPIPMWGFSGSPLIVNDTLIIYAGGSGENGLIALDAHTGKHIWGFASTDMNYTTARPMTLCDQECIIFCDSRGVHALAPETGAELWTFQPKNWKGPAMVDPQHLSSSSLLVALGDGVGLARLEVRLSEGAWSIEETWTTAKLRPSFNDSVVFRDCIFGFNQAVFSCVDAKTGERKWQGGRYGFGQTVLLKQAGQMIVAAENGDVVLLRATPERLDEIARIPVLNDKTWNHPIVVGNRLFLRNGKAAVCMQLEP